MMTSEPVSGLPVQMRSAGALIQLLGELELLAVEHAQRAAQRRTDARRPRKGATLRPGDDTPLWNAVVEKMRPHLRARGTKAGLARVLGVPSQRVHDYFVSGTQMPNAERMIHVLLWLASRENDSPAGKNPKPLR